MVFVVCSGGLGDLLLQLLADTGALSLHEGSVVLNDCARLVCDLLVEDRLLEEGLLVGLEPSRELGLQGLTLVRVHQLLLLEPRLLQALLLDAQPLGLGLALPQQPVCLCGQPLH